MKKNKVIYLSMLVCMMVFCTCACASKKGASSDDHTKSNQNNAQYVIVVKDENGTAVEDAQVQICDETTCILAATDANGMAEHQGIPYPYEIHLVSVPAGYEPYTETHSMPKEGGELMITLKTDNTNAVGEKISVVEEKSSDAPSYQLGDKMEDFSVALSDGTKVSLYDMLKEKKAVLINFWASWCYPCRMEFPYMEEAYKELSDDIGLIALDIATEDTNELINAIKEENGYTTLPMGLDLDQLRKKFDGRSIPLSVVVDRNGIICFIHAGSMPSKEKFLNLLEVYTEEDYKEPVLLDEVPLGVGIPEASSADDLGKALGITSEAIKVKLSEEEKEWPFLPSKDGTYAEASNGKTSGTTASFSVTVKLEAGQALAYDYMVAGKEKSTDDSLAIYADGVGSRFHFDTPEWKSGYIPFDKTGEHTVAFLVNRIDYQSVEAEIALKNLHVIDQKEVEALQKEEEYPKVLEGRQMEMEVLDDACKLAKINIEDENINRIYIMQDDEMTMRIKIGKDVDPNLAFLELYLSDTYLLSNLEHDEEGFLIHMDNKKDYDLNVAPNYYVMVNANIMDNTRKTSWRVLKSEADMEAYFAHCVEYMEYMKEEVPEKMTWEYVDEASKK